MILEIKNFKKTSEKIKQEVFMAAEGSSNNNTEVDMKNNQDKDS